MIYGTYANDFTLDDHSMKVLIERIDARIPSDAPKPWVIGILIWFGIAALMPVAILFIYLEWRGPYLALFWFMFVLVLCFLGCVLWFFVEFLTGRRGTWRT
jgi:hypothetical protein